MWSWSDSINKRICRYLLQRYLGQYFEEKLRLDQLTIDLYKGTGSVKNVSLDCKALNEAAKDQSLPLEFKNGHLKEIEVNVPWGTITTESCEIKVSGLNLVIQPKERSGTNAASMLDSMFTSMASSMQLAEDCLQNKDDEEEDFGGSERTAGVEKCAEAIDAVLSRVKMHFQDSVIRVERCVDNAKVGIAVEFHINSLDYTNETGENKTIDNQIYETAFSSLNLSLNGLSCYTDVFRHEGAGKLNADFEDMDGNEKCDNKLLVAKVNGRHEIRLENKTKDSFGSPQVEVNCKFGSLISILSPLQVHVLYTILDNFLNPEKSCVSPQHAYERTQREKPMESFDFRRVEEELQNNIAPCEIGTTGLRQQQGWSSPNLEDDSDEEFHPFYSKTGVMQSSATSNLMYSSVTSVVSSMQQSMDNFVTAPLMSSYQSNKTVTGSIQWTEKTKFSVAFSSAVVIVLHNDVIALSTPFGLEPHTVNEMREMSGHFFKVLGHFSAVGKKDVDTLRESLDKACDKSCHRILTTPVKIEGALRAAGNTSITSGTVTLGFMEVTEALQEAHCKNGTPNHKCIEVLTFPKYDATQPSMRVEFKTTSGSKKSKLSLKFSLIECHAELDISVVDRISFLICSDLPRYCEPAVGGEIEDLRSNLLNSLYKIRVNATLIRLNVRFPIPDLREETDFGTESRTPYYIRNVRDDSLLLEMAHFKFNTMLSSASPVMIFNFLCSKAQLHYKADQINGPMYIIGMVSSDDSQFGESSNADMDFAKIELKISSRCNDSEDSSSTTPGNSFGLDSLKSIIDTKVIVPPEKSPFSSKRIIHESPFTEPDESESKGSVSIPSVIPGDQNEMNEFIELASRNTVYSLVVDLKQLKMDLPSKALFEELYNRISTDLLLWEPSSTRFKKYSGDICDEFSTCNSIPRPDSDEEDEEHIAPMYLPQKDMKGMDSLNSQPVRRKGQSEFVFDLTVAQGSVSLTTAVMDPNEQIIKDAKGRVDIKVDQLHFFLVADYLGDPTLSYICLNSQKAWMYHADKLDETNDVKKTIFPSDEGAYTHVSEHMTNEHKDMLSLAVKIDRKSDKRLKVFKVALGIKDGTLDHKMYEPNRIWFTQLVDFFDVKDTHVEGYEPCVVLTELHCHLWNCAIDYKPLNKPYRAILAMDNFSISSNIAAQTNVSVLRFLAEDASFYITDKKESNDLRTDFVCVMDMDFMELNLRTCASQNMDSTCSNATVPKFELTLSNNVLNIRTCNDSFKALTELIKYYASFGDLESENENEEAMSVSQPCVEDGEEDKVSLHRLSQKVQDAMEDVLESDENNDKPSSDVPMEDEPSRIVEEFNRMVSSSTAAPLELHFTPTDEESESEKTAGAARGPRLYPQLQIYGEPVMEANGVIDIHPSDEDDEEFCILENDPGVGILPSANGEAEARVLTEEPIELKENHFSQPVGKLDILQAPKHFPSPVSKYLINDVSIVWHMYGGEDFGCDKKGEERGSLETLWRSESGSSLQDEPIMEFGVDPLNSGVMFSKAKAFDSAREAYSPPANRKSLSDENYWKYKGGRGRNHNVLVELHLTKVKFLWEVFPDSTKEASRQILVIKNIEILDRLKSSNFNKMMYMYTTPSRPRQSRANMLLVKAMHIRPEPQQAFEECSLRISVLPIRLNIDQDALLFLYHFFSSVSSKSESDDDDDASCSTNRPVSHTPSVESLPIMTVAEETETSGAPEDSESKESNDEVPLQDDNVSTCSKDTSVDSNRPARKVYYKQVTFAPEVPIRLDYRGKRMDMTHGPLAGLLMGLGQLSCSEIRLKKIVHVHGILGTDKLITFLANEWSNDVRKHQLPSVLGGVGPLHSIVQLFQGIKDLFWMPYEQYQKDGRIAKGLQRGASSFSSSTALATLELTNRVVQTIQYAAELTYDMVSPGPGTRARSYSIKKSLSQPGDIREGVSNAYHVVRQGLQDEAQNLRDAVLKEKDKKGVTGAVGGAIRQIPSSVVNTIIVSTKATSNVIDGVKSQINPDSKKEAEEKWKNS